MMPYHTAATQDLKLDCSEHDTTDLKLDCSEHDNTDLN